VIVLVTLLVLPAAGLLTWGVLNVAFRPRRQKIESALAPYSVGHMADADAEGGPVGIQDLVESAVVQRMVNAVGEFAARRGFMPVLEARIDQADISVRPAEALFINIVAAIIGGLLGLLLGNLFWGVLSLALVAVLPWVVVGVIAERRTRAFVEQLPDMLQLLGTTLRSGFSILQGLDTVAHQLPDPIGKEIRHVVAEARLGRPLVSAMDEVAQRVRSEDFQWVVTAIGIQREVGGNLAELLDIVAETMTARARLRQEAKTLTAEGRMSAIVISVLPVAIGLFVYVTNPGYLHPLFHSGLGELLFYGSIAVALAGMVWIRSIVKFEV
jgi:tight adherence protein B